MAVLRGTGLTKRFGDGLAPVTAVDGVDIAVAEGELVCVLGPSGCGKSTLLALLAGLTVPDSGQVELDGRVAPAPGPERMLVFQETNQLFPWLTAGGNVVMGLGARRNRVRENVSGLLRAVGLPDAENRYPHQLSGGMKQRAALARALAADPRVLLMDEPFGSLDAIVREQLQALLLSLQRRTPRSIVFVTHDVNEAAVLADRVLVMKAGGRLEHEVSPTRAAGGAGIATTAGDSPLSILDRLNLALSRRGRR